MLQREGERGTHQPKWSAGLRAGPWHCSPSFWMMHLTIFSTVSSFFSSSSSEKRQRGSEGSGTRLTQPLPGAAASAETLEKPRVPCHSGKPLGNTGSLTLEKERLRQQLGVQGEGLCCSFTTGEHLESAGAGSKKSREEGPYPALEPLAAGCWKGSKLRG